MGQHHVTVNLDRKEYLNPHMLGDGFKLLEQCGWSPGGVNDALHLLLACSNDRGGGDYHPADQAAAAEWVGRWAGDRIAVVGGYAEPDDLKDYDAATIYDQCRDDGEFRNISPDLIPFLEEAFECLYVGDGWRRRVQVGRAIADYKSSHSSLDGHGRLANIDGINYRMEDARAVVRAALQSSQEFTNWRPGDDPRPWEEWVKASQIEPEPVTR